MGVNVERVSEKKQESVAIETTIEITARDPTTVFRVRHPGG